jgi:serine O-acetyltransferase
MVMSVKYKIDGEDDKLSDCDPVWNAIIKEAELAIQNDPAVGNYMNSLILGQDSLEKCISLKLAQTLESYYIDITTIKEVFDDFYSSDPIISQIIRADISAVYDRDPACNRYMEPVLYFKGFHAIQIHRAAHWLWKNNRKDIAYHFQSMSSKLFSVDIHPAAVFGRGIFIDHATGIVIGETAIIDDDVSMLHDVTLGGTGKKGGDRHPKVKSGVLIGAGAKILGNITIGKRSRVASGSVVLNSVPENTTVAGVPAKVVGEVGDENPSTLMDHQFPSGKTPS